MEGVPTEFDLSVTLRKRLDEINVLKDSTQSKVNQENERLQWLLSKNSKKPRDTPAQLEKQIKELERRRTTTSLPLQQEKEILRQIKSIEKSIVLAKEGADRETLIQEKKADISNLRKTVRDYIAQIAELEKALSKIELANRLGCNTKDLTTHIVDCPGDKLGQIIGKNGKNLKQLENKTGCQIDVDKVKSQIHLSGSMEAIHEAVEHLENITLAVEESVVLSEAIHSHLFGKRMAAFTKLQNFHPKVYFDLSRDSKTIKIRGKPDAVSLAKENVLAIDVKMEVVTLTGRETGLVVGKGGTTVNQLVDEFNVAIDVKKKSDEVSEARIVGTENNVHLAKTKIQNLIFDNEEVEFSVVVDQLTRNKLLSDSGALIKKLQKDVNDKCEHNNTYITFEKLSKEDAKSSASSILIVKAPRMGIDQSVDMVKACIESYESDIAKMKIDLDIIPIVIGKKGAKINELRKLGKGAEVNVDKLTGDIKILASEETTRELIVKAINDIVDENQVLNVTVDESMLGLVFGQQGKDLRKKIKDEGVSIDNGETRTTVALRGRQEKIIDCAQLLRDYIDDNYTVEIECGLEEEDALMSSNSVLNKLQKDYDVKAMVMKSRGNVLIRGKQNAAEQAEKDLRKFLFGGDGFVVSKVAVPENAIGPMIGKGGSNIAKIRSKHEGVTVSINRSSNCICIRASVDQAALCRNDIIREVASVKVSDSVNIHLDQHEKLSQKGSLSKIAGGIPVELTLSHSSIKIRGRCADVSDTKVLFEDFATGVYRGQIAIDPSLWNKVSAAEENLTAVSTTTDTTIELVEKTKSINIFGKRSNVKRAKLSIFGVLDNILQSQFTKVKMLKPLLKKVGDTVALSEISIKSGCNVLLDRDTSSILVQSSITDNLSGAVDLVNERIKECEKLICVIKFEPTESWIVVKCSENKGNIEEESECRVDVMKAEFMICISGKNENQVKKAKQSVDAIIEQAHKENAFIDFPESSMNSFVGTGSRNMKQLAGKHKVSIERVKKQVARIQIQGNEGFVKSAASAVLEWIEQWEAKNKGIEIEVGNEIASSLLGSSRSTMKEIEKKCRVKIDVYQVMGSVVIRSGKNADTDTAVQKIRDFVANYESGVQEDQQMERTVPKQLTKKKEQQKQTPPPQNPSTSTNQIRGVLQEKIAVPKAPTPVQQPVKSVEQRTYVPAMVKEEKPEKSTIDENSGAGQLFNLLISGSSPAGFATAESQDHWDSSTVSSGTGSIITEGPASDGYIKSASGFTVRL